VLLIFFGDAVVDVFNNKQVLFNCFLALVFLPLNELVVACLNVLCLVVWVYDSCAKLFDLLVFVLNCIEQVVCDSLRKNWVLDLFTVLHNFDFVNAHNFGQSTRVIVEESLAKVVKVLRGEFQEHLEFLSLDLLHYKLFVEGVLERKNSLASCDITPGARRHHGLDEVQMASTVELTEDLKLLWVEYLHRVVCLAEVNALRH
jgi:hypothetical protein